MRKRWLPVLLAVALLLALTATASAITYGEPDEGEHPYVGLLGFYDEDGDWLWRCSGTLIARQVVLTAGHCTAPDEELGTPVRAQIWFDEEVLIEDDGYPYLGGIMGTPVPHPLYAGLTIPETHDIGVVLLDSAPKRIKQFGELPPAGFLDQQASLGPQDSLLTDVGYGLNDIRPEQISLRIRYKALSFLKNLTNALTDGWNLATSNNPGGWTDEGITGGTCFGDSGGPIFWGGYESDLVVGVTSFGNSNCTGTDYAYRVDLQDSLDFLSQFLK